MSRGNLHDLRKKLYPLYIQKISPLFLFFLLTRAALHARIISVLRCVSHTGGHPGGIAQLGERLNGIQEVSGSIPLISTRGYARESLGTVRFQGFFLFPGVVL